MPEEFNQQATSQPAPAAAPAQPAPAAPAQTSPQAPSQAAASPGAAFSPTGGAQATAEQQGVIDALRGMGLDFGGQVADDTAALQHLVGVYRQAQGMQHLAGYGQQYLQHADQFQRYLAEQQTQQQKAQQQQPWWKAPEYDPSWAGRLTRDPVSGELRALPGAPPDLVQKYLNWVEHQRGFLDNFSRDPIKAIRPGIEEVVREVAGQLVQQHLGGYQEQNTARGFVDSNSSWLHARDGQGNLVYDHLSGKPQLSPWGQRFASYVRQAEGAGIQSSEHQAQYALGLVQRDYLLLTSGASQNGATTGQQPVDPREQFLQQAAGRQTSTAGSITPPNVNGSAASQNPALPLRDRLKARFAQEGYQLSGEVAGGR